ncbi:protein translocase subunit SecA [Candidatus Levyibacteriota bacterium]|nr:preprotein translocase subunit SecA [Candidatus Levybacteria bacterium]GDX61714.1 protein translocase subunit SecA [Candidatus Levybacteria bacterium]
MFSALTRLFDSNEKEIKKLSPLIIKINSLEKYFKKLKEKDFIEKTKEFRNRIKLGESIDSIIPEAFAAVREASFRSIGLRHYDVQLMASAVLASGKIAEQKTGEGKTLSAVPALYLNALSGKNVHLVTVNDYLARRDAGWMAPIFHFLGLSVSSIISDQSFLYDLSFSNDTTSDFRLMHLRPVTRKEAYGADIVYGINSEFGFDYLRDNMATDLSETVQNGHHFAIVDEVDSVLIDEARTPHIISAPDDKPSQRYYEYATLVEKLSSDTDYKIDEKLKTAHLTDHGIEKIEKLYGIENIYEKDFDTVYHLEAALKARTLFHKETDYIVRDNEVILVDEFTGRLMMGRRLSEGLHQAIEAKEGVSIQRESKTLATVSLQNYFRLYEKLGGMTGTAVTEAEEFNKIYGLDVVVIPTNSKMQRIDFVDAVYKTHRAKLTAVANEIAKANKEGQPVLVGTTSIEKNEIISELLKRRGIRHEVLNAKNHLQEAEIIAKAGIKGSVTVATNMAGRGVDIILGGQAPLNYDGRPKLETQEWKKWQANHDEVVSLGGLYVIGTERHESRRIDNQLRGRSGRQGDPGASRFFVALDDEIMRLFGGETIAGLMTRFNMPEDVPLEHSLVSHAIKQAQIKVEGFNFDIRKHLVEYDDVLNKQRGIVYGKRKKLLEQSKAVDKSLKNDIKEKISKNIMNLVVSNISDVYDQEFSSSGKIVEEFGTIIQFDDESKKQIILQLDQRQMIGEKQEFLNEIALDLYDQRENNMGEKIMRQLEKFVALSTIDSLWMEHLDSIDNLRQGIGLRGYAQRDPLVEYKNDAFSMFERLISSIDDEIVHKIYKINVEHSPDLSNHPKSFVTNAPESEVSEGMGNKNNKSINRKQIDIGFEKYGRNDQCHCGSGKKYKRCHGKL